MTRNLYAEIGQRIARALEDYGMSRSELARRLHSSPPAVSRWISGESRIPIDYLRQVAQITSKPLAWFLGIELRPDDIFLHRFYELPPEKQAEVREYVEFQLERTRKEESSD